MLAKDSPHLTLLKPGTEVVLRKLLVAYDFSAFAEVALEYAVQLAEEHASEIAVAYIEQPSDLTAEMEGGLGSVKAARAQTEKDLSSMAERLRERGIPSSSYWRSGSPADTLVQLAAEVHPDLMLLGAYGGRRTDAARLGATAEFLLRCLPCPALTFGPEMAFAARVRGPQRHIVYASPIPIQVVRAVRFAEMFARAWGAGVEIVHVIDDRSRHHDSREDADMDVKGIAFADKLREIGIDAHWSLRVGSPAVKILETARQLKADMIIFEIEHHHADSAAFGTISGTIQHALCPVLTVPGPA